MQPESTEPTIPDELSAFLSCKLDIPQFLNGKEVISFIQKPVTQFYIVMDIPRQKFLAVSPSFRCITGYPPEILINGGPEFWHSLYHPQEVYIRKLVNAKITRFYQAIIPEEKLAFQYSTDLKLRCCNGQYVRLICFLICLKTDKYMQPEYLLCSFEDITHIDDNDSVTLSFHKWNGGTDRYESVHYFSYTIEGIELTRREIQVDNLVKEGLTNKQIAIKLNVSESTIKSHRKEINRKKKGI
jgi:DNA-binding CsgD family transcriptional regulator